MTDDRRDEWEKRCRWWTKQINKLLDVHAPDCVVAHAITSLWHVALGHLGKEMGAEVAKILVEDARQRAGLCWTADCEGRIHVHLTHSPVCEACNAKELAQVFRSEVEMEDEDEPC